MSLNPRQLAFADEYIITKEVYGIVYLITNKTNNKKYVGITRRSLEERFSEHCKANSLIGRAIRKHGVENFCIQRIDVAENELELFEKEIDYIDYFKSFGEGYNLTHGGDGADRRVKVNRQLSDKQIRFIKKVHEYNKKFKPNIENSKEMINFALLNTILLYLECEYETEARVVAKTITKLKNNYIEAIKRTSILDMEEVFRYAQKKSSSEVF
nr:MAG TPA: intron associated endonuclease [Caudoviricetes sp.]